MTVEQEFLDACKDLADNIEVINEYFAKEYQIKEAVGYELNALIQKKATLVSEIDRVKDQIKLLKEKGEEIEKETKENCKKIEEKSKMRLVDVENEKSRIEMEIAKLKEEKYNLERV